MSESHGIHMIKAVIFDLDGVIFDTEHKRFKDLKKVLKRQGLTLPDSKFHEMLGKKSELFIRDLYPQLSQKAWKAIAQERREIQYHNLKGGRLIKGAASLLRYLKVRFYKVAVTTGSRKFIVDQLLNMYVLRRYFDVIVTGEDYKTSKPNCECYKVTVKKLGVKPGEAIVIEDAVNGIKAAKKLGCRTYGLKTYFKGKELDIADKTFNTPTEIRRYLAKGKF
jgi:beta-phosphoglucomutase